MLMIGRENELTAEQRLSRNVARLQGHDDWTALVAALLIGNKTIVDDGPVRTAATNGRDEFYNREFVASLSDAEFRFLILHECMHKMYEHLLIYKAMHEEDPETANKAMDYAINIRIYDTDAGKKFVVMPDCGLMDEQYRGMDTPQIYRLLRQQKQQQQQQQQGQGQQGQGQPQQQQGQGQPQQGQGKPQQGQGKGQPQQGFDEHDFDGAASLSEEDRKQLAQDIDNAVRQGALYAGKIGSGGERLVGELLAPQVRWQDKLREYVSALMKGNDMGTWARPNRRFIGSGIYMPTTLTQRIGDIGVFVDTSGSIDGETLRVFLSEAASIFRVCKPDNVHLAYWDTSICRYEHYKAEKVDDIVHSTKPAGGGGTMVECVPEFIRSRNLKLKVAIVFTDGYLGGTHGNWGALPVIWCVLNNKSFNTSVGKVVHISR